MPKLFKLLFCTLFVLQMNAQQDSTIVQYDESKIDLQEITNDDLQSYRADPNFDYEVSKVDATWWDNFTTWLGNLLERIFEWFFGAEKAIGFLANFLAVLPYLLLAFLIFILIKFFMNINSRTLTYAKNNEAVVALSEEEHIIKNEDIDQLIKNAIKEKNYRLAVRYYYLLILKQLSEKELIAWEIQKTNDDYIKELKKEELKQPFSSLTLLYDYIWYGDFPVDEAKFLKAETKFTSLTKRLADHG